MTTDGRFSYGENQMSPSLCAAWCAGHAGKQEHLLWPIPRAPRVVLERSLFPPDDYQAPRCDTAFSNHRSARGLGAAPSQAHGMGEDSARDPRVLSYSGSLLKPGPQQRARGSSQKKAVDRGLILGTSWASSAPSLTKATWSGRKPVW